MRRECEVVVEYGQTPDRLACWLVGALTYGLPTLNSGHSRALTSYPLAVEAGARQAGFDPI